MKCSRAHALPAGADSPFLLHCGKGGGPVSSQWRQWWGEGLECRIGSGFGSLLIVKPPRVKTYVTPFSLHLFQCMAGRDKKRSSSRDARMTINVHDWAKYAGRHLYSTFDMTLLYTLERSQLACNPWMSSFHVSLEETVDTLFSCHGWVWGFRQQGNTNAACVYK